jgi:hypothetical protein
VVLTCLVGGRSHDIDGPRVHRLACHPDVEPGGQEIAEYVATVRDDEQARARAQAILTKQEKQSEEDVVTISAAPDRLGGATPRQQVALSYGWMQAFMSRVRYLHRVLWLQLLGADPMSTAVAPLIEPEFDSIAVLHSYVVNSSQ